MGLEALSRFIPYINGLAGMALFYSEVTRSKPNNFGLALTAGVTGTSVGYFLEPQLGEYGKLIAVLLMSAAVLGIASGYIDLPPPVAHSAAGFLTGTVWGIEQTYSSRTS